MTTTPALPPTCHCGVQRNAWLDKQVEIGWPRPDKLTTLRQGHPPIEYVVHVCRGCWAMYARIVSPPGFAQPRGEKPEVPWFEKGGRE